MKSQSNEFAFQLITSVAGAGSAASPFQTNVLGTDEIWYLFGYPDASKQAVDASHINKVVTATGGSSAVVQVLAAQRNVGVLVPQTGGLMGQQGVWVLARVPTLIVQQGPLLDNNLLDDGYLRLVYDATSNVKILSRFNTTQQLRIIQNGVVIFDANPIPGALTPLIPIRDNTNDYANVIQGVHFDGATGLVTSQPLVTINSGLISFAGWFNIDPSLSGVLEFSQGSGSNTFFLDTTLPAPTWCHMMGTIDAGANELTLLVNASVVGTPSATGAMFSGVSTNGKNLYIGTDNNGNFYKGDIADLAIWFDFSFLDNGTISDVDIGKVVFLDRDPSGALRIGPADPRLWVFGYNSLRQQFQTSPNNVQKVVQPNIFLQGPVVGGGPTPPQSQSGTLIQTIQSLNIVSGALTNSSTNPGKIFIVPT